MTYKIFEGNLERLEKKLTRIANKCKKYGCDFRYEQVGEVFEDVKDDKGEITVKVKSVKCVTSWETAYGTTRIYKILDEIGNVFTWKTGTFLEEETPGFSLVGTVKAHNEYRGIKQTCLISAEILIGLNLLPQLSPWGQNWKKARLKPLNNA